MRKVYTTHGNPFVTHHKASTDRSVSFGRSEGPDGYVTSPGSPFVDVWGREGGVYVANDTDLGSTYYETLSGTEVEGAETGEISTKSWSNGSDLAISWELDGHTAYVNGISYDISRCTGDVYACAITAEQSAIVFHRTGVSTYAFTSLSLINDVNGSGVRGSFSVTITDPVLFAGFGTSAGKLFLVTTPDSGSEVYLYKNQVPVWTGEKLYTVPPLAVDAEFSYAKEQDFGIFDGMDTTYNSGSYTHLHVHGENIQNDSVSLLGSRIVAVSTKINKLSLLIQQYSGTTNRTVNKPIYSYGEYVSIYPHVIFALGFPVGTVYNYSFGYTAYDSGKLTEGEQIESTSSFKKIDIIDGKDGVSIAEFDDALPSGSFSSLTSEYTRTVSTKLEIIELDALSVPPYEAVIATRPTYNESGGTRNRIFNSAIKLYCADVANDIYLYQRFDGYSAHNYINYDLRAFASPAQEDIDAASSNYSGTINTVLRAGGVDYVLHSRQYQEEIGTPVRLRFDLNWHPTMPYYTQYQGQYRTISRDTYGNWTNTENKTVNKSVNLAFKGRYIDRDSFKTLVSWSYKADVENDISATLNFSEFEDINKLKYNLTWSESYQPKAWQLIKGWGQFTRRAGFKTVEASGSAFVSSDVAQYPFKTLPVSLRMTS